MPPILGRVLATLDWRAVVLAVALIIMDAALYYPFLKVYERQKLQEEANETEMK